MREVQRGNTVKPEGNRCRQAYRTGVLLALAAAAMAQNPVPMIDSAPGGQGASGQAPATVSNEEYKQFDPTFSYDPQQAQAPAPMSPRQAWDYVVWTGKTMGEDFAWRRMPDSDEAIGYLYVMAPGLGLVPDEAAMHPPAPPEGMVYVPQGPFIMGSNVGDADESPRHTAYTGAYFCDQYEVSNAEYQRVFPQFEFEAGRENYPAIVTWEQASAYAERVQKRLPAEAEWEKAARGTDGRTFPWGETHDPTFYNWDETYPRGGSQACPESPYGCIDMAGGAWEWTADWYKPYPKNDTPQDQYGEMYKVLRGGASFNDVAMIRTTHRYYLPPDTTGNLYTGFRCVKDVE